MTLTIFHDEIVLIVLALALSIIALLVFMLLRHFFIAMRIRRDDRLVAQLLPNLCQAICEPERQDELLEAVSRSNHRVLLSMLVQLSLDLRGEDRKAIAQLAEKQGIASTERRRLRSRRATTRAQAAKNLGLLCVHDALPALLHLIDADSQFDVRLAGVWALGEIGDRKAVIGLLKLLEDPEPGIVRRAQEILIDTAPGASKVIVDFVQRSEVPTARCAAVEVLGALSDPLATELLLDLVNDADSELRIKAVKAAASIADPRFLAIFRRLLSDPVWPIRCQAARGLGTLGNEVSIPELREALKDVEWWVRFNAAVALSEMGSAGHRALVESQSDANRYCHEVARYVLERSDANRVAA